MTEMTPEDVKDKLSFILSELGIIWSTRDEILGAFSVNPEKYSKPERLYKLLMMFDFLGHKKCEFIVEEALGLDDFTARAGSW